MFGDEDLAAIRLGELPPAIEAHSQRGDMGAEIQRRWHEFAARALAAELGIGKRTAVTVGIAEMQAGPRRVVQFVGRQIVAQQVAPVVGEPQFAGSGLPVEADAVAHAACDYLEIGAIRPHAGDDREAFRVRLADIARSPDRHVEPAIRTEGDEFPAMVALPREIVPDCERRRGIVEVPTDAVEAQDAVDRRNMEISIAESDADGHRQAAGNDSGARRPVFTVELNGMDLALSGGTHVNNIAVTEGHLPCVGNPRQNLDRESVGETDRAERQVVGKGSGAGGE